MKYKLTIVLLLVASLSQAQKWHYGPKLDLNLTQLNGKGMQSGFNSGAQVGVFVRKAFNNKWSLQPELLYTMNTVKKADNFLVYYNNNIGRANAREKIQLNAVSVPVLARYELTEKFSLLAGPQFSYIFNTNEDLLKSGAEAFKKSEVSLNVGGQFNLGGFGVSVRYNRGLSDLNNIDDRYSWHTDHIQIGFAVMIK